MRSVIQGSDSRASLDEIAGEESEASWTEVLHSLIERDVGLRGGRRKSRARGGAAGGVAEDRHAEIDPLLARPT